MKKILVVALSVALLLSTTACGTNSELEALKQENEQLKSQLSDTEEKLKNQPKSQLKSQPKNRLKNQRNKKLQILNPTPIALTNLPQEVMKYLMMYQAVSMTLLRSAVMVLLKRKMKMDITSLVKCSELIATNIIPQNTKMLN